MAHFEVVADFGSKLGEGPIWDQASQELWWTDISGGFVYRLDARSGNIQTVIEGRCVSGFALNRTGGLVCALRDEGLAFWTPEHGFEEIARSFDGVHLAFNDTIADARGRFLAATKYYDANDANYRRGTLLRLNKDRSLHVLEDGLHLANGMGFSPDNRVFYLTDSVAREIYAYDYDLEAGTISNRRTLISLRQEDGLPDGMTVDSEGCLWSAIWYGQCVIRFDPDGRERTRLATPMKQTSSVMFGGPDLCDLYVTTAGEGGPSSLAPPGYDFQSDNIGGPVYRFRSSVQGKPEYKADIQPL